MNNDSYICQYGYHVKKQYNHQTGDKEGYNLRFDNRGNKFLFATNKSLGDLPNNIQVILDMILENSEIIEVYVGNTYQDIYVYNPEINFVNTLNKTGFVKHGENGYIWSRNTIKI